MSSSIDSRTTPTLGGLELSGLERSDLGALDALIRANKPIFSEEECLTALAMLEESLKASEDDDPYRVVLARRSGRVLGFACYGTIPLTQGSFDLYWIVVVPASQGRGVGQALLLWCEADMVRRSGRIVMAETSDRADYASARRFYEQTMGFERVACVADFYRAGEDKIIYRKRLAAG